MSKKFFTDIKNIRSAIDKNKLVVFAGAGISVDAGIPDWNFLIEEMKSDIEIAESEQDDLRIAQMYFNDRQPKEYIDKIRSVLNHKKIKHNEIHEEIFHLNPEHILTTNYDDLLEQVIKKQSLPFSIVSKDKQFPYALNTNLLVKVHGDLDTTDIVLKEDDYIDYSLNHPLIEAFLKSVFASKIVLFVGYSFSDINLKMIIQTVRNILGNDFQNAYMISVDETLHPTQREYLKRKGINVVNYIDAVNDKGENYITEYLNGNNALKEIYFKKGEYLSQKGQKLLNILKFISSYDKFNEPLTEKNVIDQIYYSLNRFAELKSLPPDFVANLYPFNNSKGYVNNYERYSLLTKNKIICEVFYNQIVYIDDQPKFKPSPDIYLSEEQINKFEIELREIIRTLNSSLIFYICKENEKPDSFGYYGWSKDSKKLHIKSNIKCNCSNCCLNRLDLSSVISSAFNSNINETTSIQSDLELAYLNYKIGNFKQSYQLFEETANKAWQTGKYFSYYISKRNIKKLHNLINWYEIAINDVERKKILNILEDIDFDKLLFQIPYIGKTEYELLKTIRDDEILVRAEEQIEITFANILNAYDGYKDGRKSIMGPYHPRIIEIELYKITTFYQNNFIVADEFDNFTKICKKGIEALMISFATSDDYKEKVKEFNKLFFHVVTQYGNAKEIQSIAKKYEIHEIRFDEISLVEIIESVNNFLKSFFQKFNFMGIMTSRNKLTQIQVENDFFENKCRTIFSNIFVLLSGVNLPQNASIDLVPNLLTFIEHETFLFRSELNFLYAFIHKNHKLFSKQDIENLLNSNLNKPKIYSEGALLETIADVFRNNDYAGIENRNLILKIDSISNENNWQSDTIIFLWEISNDIIKKELKREIIQRLDMKFDSLLYREASLKKIIDFNPYFEQYISEINRTKGNGHYTLQAGKPWLNSAVFINSMIFLYKLKLSRSDKRLTGLTELANYMKFYISPETFNYEEFKTEWLYMVDGREIFQPRFSKIPALKKQVEKTLKEKFNADLAEIYTKYFFKMS